MCHPFSPDVLHAVLRSTWQLRPHFHRYAQKILNISRILGDWLPNQFLLDNDRYSFSPAANYGNTYCVKLDFAQRVLPAVDRIPRQGVVKYFNRRKHIDNRNQFVAYSYVVEEQSQTDYYTTTRYLTVVTQSGLIETYYANQVVDMLQQMRLPAATVARRNSNHTFPEVTTTFNPVPLNFQYLVPPFITDVIN